ncbi:MAG: DNA processing protein [Pontimonas sp.]|jgi:DNA processing protein
MGSETLARIAWGFMAHPGDGLAWALTRRHGVEDAAHMVASTMSPTSVLTGLAEDIFPADYAQLERWRARFDPDQVQASHQKQHHAGIQVMGSGDPLWPARMNDLGPAAPVSLWARGDPGVVARGREALAVVGSRHPTGAGLAHTTAIVQGAWCDGVGIVSGGALGIDSIAHQASLAHRRVPIAVLAGGLEAVYPSDNVSLMTHIAERGVVLSEAPCGMRIRPERFLARNRLIAALSYAVVVVEAAHRSGAINTAHHAAGLGREIGVVPGRWEDKHARGCFRIVREQGAMVLTEPADVGFLLPGVPTHSPKLGE